MTAAAMRVKPDAVVGEEMHGCRWKASVCECLEHPSGDQCTWRISWYGNLQNMTLSSLESRRWKISNQGGWSC